MKKYAKLTVKRLLGYKNIHSITLDNRISNKVGAGLRSKQVVQGFMQLSPDNLQGGRCFSFLGSPIQSLTVLKTHYIRFKLF